MPKINPKLMMQASFGKSAIRAYYAEFAGMVFFLGISVGTVVGAFKTVSGFSQAFLKGASTATIATSGTDANWAAAVDNAMVLIVAFAFGMSIMVLAYSIGHISGGHFNPAVTFACLIFGKIGPIKALCYIISQCLGSMVGVGLDYALLWRNYGDAVKWGTNNPTPGLENWQVILMEMLGTSFLTYVVFGTAIDPKATPLVTHMAPFAIGFTVFLAHIMLIPVDGCGINPARSTGSAVVSGDFTNLWIYWAGPMIGGPLGAAIHYLPLQFGDKLEDQNAAMNMDARDDGDAGGDGDGNNADADNTVDTTGGVPGQGVSDKK